jgi:hypothetical protein
LTRTRAVAKADADVAQVDALGTADETELPASRRRITSTAPTARRACKPGAVTTVRPASKCEHADVALMVNVDPHGDERPGGSTGQTAAADSASVSVPENTTAVTTMTATDPDAGATIVYSGGADTAQFAIDPSSGALTFIAAPNFEAPTDTGADMSMTWLSRRTTAARWIRRRWL